MNTNKDYVTRFLSIVSGLSKTAGAKPPTDLATVKELINNLKTHGLKRVKFQDIFKNRPQYAMYRGQNALPAHARRIPATGKFKDYNVIGSTRYEHFTPYPENSLDYGKFVEVLDIKKHRPLMSGGQALAPDFRAAERARYMDPAISPPDKFERMITRIVTSNPQKISELHGIDSKGKLIFSPKSPIRGGTYEAVIPSRYADRHSKVYLRTGDPFPVRAASFANGGRDPIPDDIFKQTAASRLGMRNTGALNTTRLITTNPDFELYDASPLQRLAKIMHRHPEYKDEIFPVLKPYLGLGESGMAGF